VIEGRTTTTALILPIIKKNAFYFINNDHTVASPASENVLRSVPVPHSLPLPACQPWNAHRYLPANARGTLLPPSPPEPQRGHTRTRNSLASQLASTAELPLKITAELHPTPHKKIRQPQFGSVTLRSPIIPFSSKLSLSFIAKMRLTYFLN
jgi:hypothetical protein